MYFGYKTEFKAPRKERNYYFAFNPIDESEKVWAAFLGKFTLAPSLAKHIYTTLEGTPPPVQAFSADEAAEVGMTERVEAQKSIKAELNQIAKRDV